MLEQNAKVDEVADMFNPRITSALDKGCSEEKRPSVLKRAVESRATAAHTKNHHKAERFWRNSTLQHL